MTNPQLTTTLDAATIRPASDSEIDWCAELMASNDPWLTYQCSVQWSMNVLRWPGSSLFVADTGKPVGLMLLHPKGFLGSPYIAAIVVVEDFRGRRIGSRMLAFAEGVFTGSRHAYLCVSSFNPRALALYERHGYVKVGELPDFIAEGYAEFLLCKRLS
ncbi:MAG: GNAT family N-acetyltransferase [Candidatus Sulfotelmatobacter sp.]